MLLRWLIPTTILWLATAAGAAHGGVVFGNDGLTGGYRWDAAPKTIGQNERSLDGGLRYSLEGGSFQAYRDLFQWTSTPTVADFQLAVEQAFAAWTAVDPITGLESDLSFVADLSTTVVGTGGFGEVDVDGAEIDLLAVDASDSGQHAAAYFNTVNDTVTLTSGTPDYPGSGAISGADITINSNINARYGLDRFRRLLTHEIGHALGLGDVDRLDGESIFIDDNYDGSSSETVLATLTNSWAMLVDPLNPAASSLDLYFVPNANPGVKTAGVNILMESSGLGISTSGNPVESLVPLVNDDFGTRQFLYPSLERVADLPGDYDASGTVDAADYTMWRDHLGEMFSLANETTTFGSVTEEDYDVWVANFGTSSAAGAAAGATLSNPSRSVPEPASMLLLSSGALLVWRRKRAKRPAVRRSSAAENRSLTIGLIDAAADP